VRRWYAFLSSSIFPCYCHFARTTGRPPLSFHPALGPFRVNEVMNFFFFTPLFPPFFTKVCHEAVPQSFFLAILSDVESFPVQHLFNFSGETLPKQTTSAALGSAMPSLVLRRIFFLPHTKISRCVLEATLLFRMEEFLLSLLFLSFFPSPEFGVPGPFGLPQED